jgi:hypothetical protein
MFTLIVMTRYEGFSTGAFAKYQDAQDKAVAVTLANPETTAVIYNGDGQLIWRMFGNVEAPKSEAKFLQIVGRGVRPAPVATDSPLAYRVTTGPNFDLVQSFDNDKMAIVGAGIARTRLGTACSVWRCVHDEQQLIYSTAYRVDVGDGRYYAADGTFMNANGTRNIFDDVDAVK